MVTQLNEPEEQEHVVHGLVLRDPPSGILVPLRLHPMGLVVTDAWVVAEGKLVKWRVYLSHLSFLGGEVCLLSPCLISPCKGVTSTKVFFFFFFFFFNATLLYYVNVNQWCELAQCKTRCFGYSSSWCKFGETLSVKVGTFIVKEIKCQILHYSSEAVAAAAVTTMSCVQLMHRRPIANVFENMETVDGDEKV